MPTPSILEIAAVFLHLGCTAFGGLAMLEPMRRRVVEKQNWLQPLEFLDGLALCQMLPGATVVQMAAYVGYRLRRTPGALSAAAGFVLPAFVLMTGLSYLYFHYGALPWVKAISRGLNAMVIALLLQALWRFGRSLGRGWPDWLVACLTFLALAFQAAVSPGVGGRGSAPVVPVRGVGGEEPSCHRRDRGRKPPQGRPPGP